MIEAMESSEEKNQESDKNEIKELLEDIDIFDIKPEHHRIGMKKEKERKRRPMKLILKYANEKQRIMKNLYKLKTMGYLRISISDDFTIKEREKIKEMHEKAKKKNTECDGGDFIWRVRGSPRTCLLYTSPSPRDRTRSRMPSSA